ncbi:MAG: hypothetical protein K0Q51_613 [Rickettsiaceae bacterium]|jgi:hypothetical protein|nr:hypothetical protein [Rickettsiaceae bacterium]
MKEEYLDILPKEIRAGIAEDIDEIIFRLKNKGITNKVLMDNYCNVFISLLIDNIEKLEIYEFINFLSLAPIAHAVKPSLISVHDLLHDLEYKDIYLIKKAKDIPEVDYLNAIKGYSVKLIQDWKNMLLGRIDENQYKESLKFIASILEQPDVDHYKQETKQQANRYSSGKEEVEEPAVESSLRRTKDMPKVHFDIMDKLEDDFYSRTTYSYQNSFTSSREKDFKDYRESVRAARRYDEEEKEISCALALSELEQLKDHISEVEYEMRYAEILTKFTDQDFF